MEGLTEGQKMMQRTIEGVLLNAIKGAYGYDNKQAEKALIDYTYSRVVVVK